MPIPSYNECTHFSDMQAFQLFQLSKPYVLPFHLAWCVFVCVCVCVCEREGESERENMCVYTDVNATLKGTETQLVFRTVLSGELAPKNPSFF